MLRFLNLEGITGFFCDLFHGGCRPPCLRDETVAFTQGRLGPNTRREEGSDSIETVIIFLFDMKRVVAFDAVYEKEWNDGETDDEITGEWRIIAIVSVRKQFSLFYQAS